MPVRYYGQYLDARQYNEHIVDIVSEKLLHLICFITTIVAFSKNAWVTFAAGSFIMYLLSQENTKRDTDFYRLKLAIEGALFNSNDIAVKLLEKDPDLAIIKEKGTTLLHVAAIRGDSEIISLLLSKGSSIDEKDEYGATPLCLAAGAGHYHAALILIRKGADINGSASKVPLVEASVNQKADIISLLIKHGADPQSKYKIDGMTPLKYTINHTSTTSLILNVEEGIINRLCSDSGLELKELYEKSLLYKNGDENTPIEAKTFYLFMKINEIYLNFYKYISDKKFEKHGFSSKLFSDIKDTQKLIQDLKIKSPLIDDFSKLCECVFGSDECESLVPRLKFFAASKVFKDPDYYKDLLEEKELPQSIKLYVQELCKVTTVKYSKLEEVRSTFIGESSESIHEIE